MSYGVLVILVPPQSSWPEDWGGSTGRNAEVINAWRERLQAWEQGVKGDASQCGARSVLSFAPMQQTAFAQANVWMDDVGEDLTVAIKEAGLLTAELVRIGHEIQAVQILNWTYNPW
jgi:hypothetical protein